MSELRHSGGVFDLPVCAERLDEVLADLEQPDVWQDPERAKKLNKEKNSLESLLAAFQTLDEALDEAEDWRTMYATEGDEAAREARACHDRALEIIEQQEFARMFSGELDNCDAFVSIQAGSGGTEAQDWAEMLLRMYLRWAQSRGFKPELLECSQGDVAGIKSATLRCEGAYAYGWLRTESGVHRLVRKSPFDSNNKRHTSFAAVFVSPVVDDTITIDINPADLKIDTYRASGAGGQHVNRTDSAIRITHMPTGIVVQCQSDRSQHKNRSTAMSQLKARLYQLERDKQLAHEKNLEAGKDAIEWGSQIRSYVLDDSRVKDLRTGYETTNTQAMLDGEVLDRFIEASLKQGVDHDRHNT